MEAWRPWTTAGQRGAIAEFGSEFAMKCLTVNLPEALDRFVLSMVERGRFENSSEVVCAALRALEHEEQKLEESPAAPPIGLDGARDMGEIGQVLANRGFYPLGPPR
jgi:putative addiction module CopG family antidote